MSPQPLPHLLPFVHRPTSGELECADGEGGHHHGDRVEHCLAHQLRVVRHHRCCRLLAEEGSGGLAGGGGSGSADVRVQVIEGVGDVGYWLGVQSWQVLAQMGHSDVADGLVVGGTKLH